ARSVGAEPAPSHRSGTRVPPPATNLHRSSDGAGAPPGSRRRDRRGPAGSGGGRVARAVDGTPASRAAGWRQATLPRRRRLRVELSGRRRGGGAPAGPPGGVAGDPLVAGAPP